MPAWRKVSAEQIRRAEELLGVYDSPKPARSPMMFRDIGMRTGLAPVQVTYLADHHEILPPKRAGSKPGSGVGRPSEGRPKFSPHREPAYALFAEGKTSSEAAHALGIQRQATHVFRKDWLALREAAHALFKIGRSVADVTAALGLSESLIQTLHEEWRTLTVAQKKR
jgi:hypothetical protein